MKDPHIQPDQVAGETRSPLTEPALLADALSLAGGFAFEMGEDGQMDFADLRAMERFLVERTGLFDHQALDWNSRLEPQDHRQRQRAVASLRFRGARYQLDYALRNAMGETRHVREIAEAQACADGRATLIRGVILDRTDSARSDQAIIWSARHDPLTRLPNMDALQSDGTLVAELAGRLGIPAYLLRLRIGNLETLIETFDDNLGEQLVQAAAARLETVLRAPDLLSRINPTDFAVCTINREPQALAQQLRAAITVNPYDTSFGPLALELGVEIAPLDTVEQALSITRARFNGETEKSEAISTGSDTPINVSDLLADDRLELAFQPIVHARTGALHHHECLLRLRTESGALSSAFKVILAAEESGQIAAIDQHALELAIPHLETSGVHLALNVSAGTIADAAACETYLDRLRGLGDAATRLTIEMTETVEVDDPAKAARFAAEVRGLGCQFAIDDFGSGHTSFRNLLAVEADSIKIDGSLVRGVAIDENKQAFIRMMVDLAATFSVKTVAEMVEDRADAKILARLGVDYLQGYYFGKPGPTPEGIPMTG